MNKHSITLIFYLVSCLSSVGQNVEVSLEIGELSPFIRSFTKEEMKKKLLDSVVSSCNAEFAEFVNNFKFYQREQAPDLVPDYKLELIVYDTLCNAERFNEIYMVVVRTKFYEQNSPPESVESWMGGSGVSYGYDKLKINEYHAIAEYISWSKAEASSIIREYLPLSLTQVFPAKNLPRGQLALLERNRNVVVTIEAGAVNHQHQHQDVGKISTMIQNAFLLRQEFYYRATRRTKGYFNYYISSNSIPADVVASHPIKIQFLINCGTLGCDVRLQTDDKQVELDPSKTMIHISKEMLLERPSLVNSKLSSSIASFVFKNL
jgi:hypothetical protein